MNTLSLNGVRHMVKNIISVSLFRTSIILLFSANILASCSPSQDIIVAEQFSPVPIQEIREEMNVPVSSATDALHLVLAQHNLKTKNGLTQDGSFVTNIIKIQDTICLGKHLPKAPVSCQLSFQGSLKAVGHNKSSLNLRYKENCLEQHVVCKDSNAERLLFSIHREIREQIRSYQ